MITSTASTTGRPGAALTRRTLVLASLAAACGAQASTAPPEIVAELPDARLIGSGRLRFLGLSVYDARLWAPRPPGPADWVVTPLALEIEYSRSLVGRLIAERSIAEMRRVGDFDDEVEQRWLAALAGMLPDVQPGDRITGVQRPQHSTRLFANARPLGELRDPEFTRLFFGIWLAPQTSEPKLRQALLGSSRG
jgi:hypothetical protein